MPDSIDAATRTASTQPATAGSSAPEDVTITVRDNASYRVAGPITLLDGAGNAFAVESGKTVALCRCGGSATKPFCDGTHRSIGFESAVRATPAGDESAAG